MYCKRCGTKLKLRPLTPHIKEVARRLNKMGIPSDGRTYYCPRCYK